MTRDHPLAGLIAAAAAGQYPAADGIWRRVPPWHPEIEAIVAFTGHAVLAVAPGIPDRRLVRQGADGFGGAHDPRLITALAGPGGWIGSLDILMASRGSGHPDAPPPRLAGRTWPRTRERCSRPGCGHSSGCWVTLTGAAQPWP